MTSLADITVQESKTQGRRRGISWNLVAGSTILGLVLAVAVIATLQDALTLDLMSPQDQNVVIGALLVASVILPNTSSIYARARTRLESMAARRASRRPPLPGSSAP